MVNGICRGKLGKGSSIFFVLFIAMFVSISGCSRGFYRKLADKEAYHVLAEKDRIPQAEIEQFYLRPHPLARFYSPYNPDRPPMPPEDPVVASLAPNPQKPSHKSGSGWVEGDGYRQLLDEWNAENRMLQVLRKQQESGKAGNAATAYAHSDKKSGLHPRGKIGVQVLTTYFPTRASDSKVKHASFQEKLVPPELIKDKGKKPEKLPPPDLRNGKEKLPQPLPIDGKDATPIHGQQQPYLITLEQAVQLGIINSREFQNRREDLYLNALPVTLQRYSFAAQFFMTEEIIRQRLGRQAGDANNWVANSNAGFTKLFPTGALLALQFANQTVINLTGSGPHTLSVSDINLDLAQPFLRGGGKAVTLEPLTQTERDMVYEIRSYARFRKLFFVSIAGGAEGLPGSTAPGFGGGVGIGSGLGVLTGPVAPGSAGRVVLATGQLAPVQGYLPTLRIAAQLDNEKKNVAALKRNLEVSIASKNAGRIDKIQVDDVTLQLQQSKNNVLDLLQRLNTALDQLKQQLGLPVNVLIELDDAPIRPIKQHLDRYEDTLTQTFDILKKAEKASKIFEEKDEQRFRKTLLDLLRFHPQGRDAANNFKIEDPQLFRKLLIQLLQYHPLIKGTELGKTIFERWEGWKMQNKRRLNVPLINEALKPYTDQHKDLLKRLKLLGSIEAELLGTEGEPALDPKDKQKLREIQNEIKELESSVIKQERVIVVGELEKSLQIYESLPAIKREFKYRQAVLDRFYYLVLEEARGARDKWLRENWPKLPPVVVNGVDLIRPETDENLVQGIATSTALTDRLDVMNARAQVVDTWRQVAILANSLLGVFNVRYHMDSTTPGNQAKPLNFDGRRTKHQLILNAELPLVRKAERNAYRAGLIGFERARRSIMALEDRVAADVRNEVRQLRLLAQTYVIQQKNVDVSYPKEENARELLFGPKLPGAGLQRNSAQSTTLTNQLLRSQQQKLRAQNDAYNTWIDYLITRLRLYRDLERMPLDQRGVWIDELATSHSTAKSDQPGNQWRDAPIGQGAEPEGFSGAEHVAPIRIGTPRQLSSVAPVRLGSPAPAGRR